MKDLLQEFKQFIDDVYGTYLDSIEGFRHVSSEAAAFSARIEKEFSEKKASDPTYRNFEFGGVSHGYARLVRPGQEGRNIHLHQIDMPELVARNVAGGRNHVLIGRMVVVTIYQYWDDHIRKRLGALLGVPSDTIKVPILGDMRHFRGSIIHNQSRSEVRLSHYEVLTWFDKDQLLDFRQEHIEEIVDRLLAFVQDFSARPMAYISAEPEREPDA